jgi:hypothetical protein
MPALRATVLVTVVTACFAEAPPVESSTEASASTDPTSASGTSTSVTTDATSITNASSISGVDTSSETSASGTPASSEGSSSAGDSSETTAAMCGNGVVEDGEMCDGTEGCDAACEFTNYACNPLNDAGCPAAMRCGLVDFATETFACMSPGRVGLGGVCEGSPPNDGECGAELTCLFHGQTLLCDEGACCVRYCDLTEGVSGCGVDEVCAPFFPMPMFSGLEHLGFCYS